MLNFLVFICSSHKYEHNDLCCLFLLKIEQQYTNLLIAIYIFIFCIWMRENCFYINGTFIFVSVKHASWGNFIVKYEPRSRALANAEQLSEKFPRARVISQTFGNSSLKARARDRPCPNHKRVRDKILHLHFCVEHILKRPNKI